MPACERISSPEISVSSDRLQLNSASFATGRLLSKPRRRIADLRQMLGFAITGLSLESLRNRSYRDLARRLQSISGATLSFKMLIRSDAAFETRGPTRAGIRIRHGFRMIMIAITTMVNAQLSHPGYPGCVTHLHQLERSLELELIALFGTRCTSGYQYYLT